MTKVSRSVTVFNNLAGFEVSPAIMLSYVEAIIAQRALDGRDPSRPEIAPPVLTNEEKAALFLNWLRTVIKSHKIEAAALPSITAAEAAREAARTDAITDLGVND